MFNFYKDAYDNQRYDAALGYLPTLLEKSPRGAQNIYVYAINIYKTKIQRERDRNQRNVYVDSLLLLYDMRIQNFGDHPRYGRGYTLKQKAKDYLLFRPADREGVREVFQQAIEANVGAPDLDFINVYFKELTDDYAISEIIETDLYMEEYEKLAGIVENVTDPAAEEAKKTFDAIFISSGAADCNGIERIYKDRLVNDPTNIENYSKVYTLLSRQNCDSPFFFEVAEQYFRLEPTSGTAIALAKAYEKQGNNRKSMDYLRAAVDSESDPVSKANLCVQIAGMELEVNNAQNAASFAKLASQYNPENGYAYMFLAQSYVLGAASNCSDFDRQTVYWLAYDLVQRSRRIFADSSEDRRQAENLMALFRGQFPPIEEIFYRALKEGETYDVKCGWITGRTTVKEAK